LVSFVCLQNSIGKTSEKLFATVKQLIDWHVSFCHHLASLQIPPYRGNLNEIAVRLTGIEMGTSLENFHCIIVSICICWYYSVKSIAGKLKKYILSLFFRWYDIFIGLVKY
jgi:hypothetical protein